MSPCNMELSTFIICLGLMDHKGLPLDGHGGHSETKPNYSGLFRVRNLHTVVSHKFHPF